MDKGVVEVEEEEKEEEDHVEIVRLLCDRGADVEAFNNGGFRPLYYAAYNGHISVVKELIEERNAYINARDDGWRNGADGGQTT